MVYVALQAFVSTSDALLETLDHATVRPFNSSTDVRRLTTGIPSEKCVVRRFRRRANVIECTYTNLDIIAYYTPRLYGIAYSSWATNLYSMLLY
jgi:hypothetical protein